MRTTVSVVVVALVVAPSRAPAQDTAGAFVGASEEELTVTWMADVRAGRYLFQPQFPVTVIYEDAFNDGTENVSMLGVFTFVPLMVAALMGHGTLEEPGAGWVPTFARRYAMVTSVFNSQHHLVLAEGGPGKRGWLRAASVFAGPRTEHFIKEPVAWGRFALGGGVRLGLWKAGYPESPFDDRLIALHVGVEKPWDVIAGEWHEQDALVFGGVVFGGY